MRVDSNSSNSVHLGRGGFVHTLKTGALETKQDGRTANPVSGQSSARRESVDSRYGPVHKLCNPLRLMHDNCSVEEFASHVPPVILHRRMPILPLEEASDVNLSSFFHEPPPPHRL